MAGVFSLVGLASHFYTVISPTPRMQSSKTEDSCMFFGCSYLQISQLSGDEPASQGGTRIPGKNLTA